MADYDVFDGISEAKGWYFTRNSCVFYLLNILNKIKNESKPNKWIKFIINESLN